MFTMADYTFKINLAKVAKAIKGSNTKSDKCLAVIINTDNGYRARVRKPDTDNEFYVIKLSKESLSLKGKTQVFSTKRDNGKPILILRDEFSSKIHPGTSEQYTPFIDGVVVSGYVRKTITGMTFEFDKLVSFSEEAYNSGHYINFVNINNNNNLLEQ